MIFKITNNISKKSYQFSVEDYGDSMLYYHFDVTFESLVDEGEYTYNLYDDEEKVLLATGMLQVGDYIPEYTTTYIDNNKTEFIQYNG